MLDTTKLVEVTEQGVDVLIDQCQPLRKLGQEVWHVNHDRRTRGWKILDKLFGYDPAQVVELLDE